MLRMEGIGVSLGEFRLRDVLFHVAPGIYLALLGPTGTAKTARGCIGCSGMAPGRKFSRRSLPPQGAEHLSMMPRAMRLSLFIPLAILSNSILNPAQLAAFTEEASVADGFHRAGGQVPLLHGQFTTHGH
jgi:hypothetical protein